MNGPATAVHAAGPPAMVRLLVLFLYDEKLTDFRLPELQCVAETLGVPVSWDGVSPIPYEGGERLKR